ncbi:MAG: DUF4424 domain-containing protein [Alphaproteobacteria bacterium]|nr:DUF4424 domain-containing protein [Alphaproteobacteria bacterium]
MPSLSRLCAAAALAAVLAAPAFANDGFGGLTATGLQFQDTADVQMLSEDLFLGLDQIRVSYVFRHTGEEDVTGEVIFPLPPINLSGLMESDFAIPREDLDKENFVGFTATVDGKKVPVKTDRIAVIEEPWDENRQLSASYDSPGADITATLEENGIPLSLDFDKVVAALKALPPRTKKEFEAAGLAFFDDSGEAYPSWSIIERYHWTQTFRAGKDVKIAHSYRSAPPGGIFVWREPSKEEGDYIQTLVDKYCIDKGTQSAIKKALIKSDGDGEAWWNGMAYYLDYVLTTANTWNGPIGTFKLTIDKGDPKNVLSLCIDGIKKTGPTTFVVEKKNFTPKSDLNLLIVSNPGSE